ncbi:hypothetical protein C5E11_16810 [Clavibacter michiganensis]|nr:hypothetical protein C5E11_16810 [Clavibacter michiganensis]
MVYIVAFPDSIPTTCATSPQARLVPLPLFHTATRWHEKVEETDRTALPLSSSVFHSLYADTTFLCAEVRS